MPKSAPTPNDSTDLTFLSIVQEQAKLNPAHEIREETCLDRKCWWNPNGDIHPMGKSIRVKNPTTGDWYEIFATRLNTTLGSMDTSDMLMCEAQRVAKLHGWSWTVVSVEQRDYHGKWWDRLDKHDADMWRVENVRNP